MRINFSYKTSEITSEQVLAYARRVEAQRAQKRLMGATKYNKAFDAMTRHKKRNNTFDRANSTWRETLISCKYWGNSHMPRRCPAYGNIWLQCDKVSHFEKVCRTRAEVQGWPWMKSCSWNMPRQWKDRGGNTGVQCSKMKCFQLS